MKPQSWNHQPLISVISQQLDHENPWKSLRCPAFLVSPPPSLKILETGAGTSTKGQGSAAAAAQITKNVLKAMVTERSCAGERCEWSAGLKKTPNWQVVMCWNYPRLIRKNAALPKWSAPKAISKPASKRVQKIGESKMFNVRLTSQSRPLARLSLETTPKSNPSLVPWNPVIPKGLWGGNPKSIWIWVVIHSVADFLKKITAATVTRTIYICIYIYNMIIYLYI